MAENWEYAQLVKTASENGGVDAYMSAVKAAEYSRGGADMKAAMNGRTAVLSLVSAGVASVVTYAISKMVSAHKERKEKNRIETERAAVAEQIIVQKLREAEFQKEEADKVDVVEKEDNNGQE